MDVCVLGQQSMQLLGCAGDQGWIIRSLCSDGPINPAGYRMIWLAQVAQKLLIRPNLRSQGWQLISESWNWLCVQYVTIWIESKFGRSHFQTERIFSEEELKFKQSSDWVVVLHEHEDIVPIVCSICTSRCNGYEYTRYDWKNDEKITILVSQPSAPFDRIP